MAFLFALGFAMLVLLAGHRDGVAFVVALFVGLGIGAWISVLIDRRLRAASPASADADLKTIYAALQDIHWRLKRLETTQGLGPSPLEAEKGTSDVVTMPASEVPPSGMPPECQPALVATTSGEVPATASAQLPLPPGAALPPTGSDDLTVPQNALPKVTPSSPPAGQLVVTLLARARQWLLSGNTVVRVGIVVLFFGVAFLLRFAIERTGIPIELRVIGIGLGAIALLAIGWSLRTQRMAYALALQGAGAGLLYLTLFGAFRLYHLIPSSAALLTMIAVAGLSVALALLQDAPSLVAIGITGGFLAPILTSTEGGHHVALFTYYLILNAGILTIAWFRAWRSLNLLGFFFTTAVGLLWGTTSYSPDLFTSTEPFLIAFFALYLSVSVLYTWRQEQSLETVGTHECPRLSVVDLPLVFGLPLVVFGFQAGLLADLHSEFALAYSALGLAVLYSAVAFWLFRSRPSLPGPLAESFTALAVIFTTVAIPLALDARGTSAVWALEGAALVWTGLRQQQGRLRSAGLLLQAAAALAWFGQPGSWHAAAVPLANPYCLGAFLIAISGLFSAWQLQTRLTSPSPLTRWIFSWGLAWWLLAGTGEAHRLLDGSARLAAYVSYLAATALIFDFIAPRLAWRDARLPGQWLAPGLGCIFIQTLGNGLHAFAGGGMGAWPAALIVHFVIRYRHDTQAVNGDWSGRLHAAGFWLLAALGSHELHWLAGEFTLAHGWRWAALVIIPGALLHLAASEPARIRWPIATAASAYLGWGAWPLLSALAFWIVIGDLTLAADTAPLPWVPLLNPVDLAHLYLGLVTWHWARRAQSAPDLVSAVVPRHALFPVLGALAFVWLNAVLLRSLHHWTGVAYQPDALFASTLVQAALSLFWTILALLLMAGGARSGRRPLWMTGAVLMAVVVVKLFLIDLDRVGSVARIVSFLGVGLLMLLIGYLAPVPPRPATSDSDSPPEA